MNFWNSINQVLKQEASILKTKYFKSKCHVREKGEGRGGEQK